MAAYSRRALLFGSASLLAALAGRARTTPTRSRIVLLATGGGPRARKERGATASAIAVGDALYVIDCGNGVARQLVQADLALPDLRHVFVTHHHFDHNADYGNLLLTAWVAGLKTRVDGWGPPPLVKMTRLFLEMNDVDIRTRIADEGRTPLASLIFPHELTAGGIVMEDERVKVKSALVEHPPMSPCFGYRFDCPDRSVVFSGDTRPSDNLVRLARGVDILVHEAAYLPAIDRLAARVPSAKRLRESILSHHTPAEEAGRVAAAAGVKTLVLSHLVPADDPSVTEGMWIDAARQHFSGTIVVARDGLEL